MPSERILFDSTLIRMGHFSLGPDERLWSEENVIGGTLVVFPAVPVMIHQAEREPVVADRNVVMYYNEGQPYRRALLHERGDDAVWIAMKGDLGAALRAEFCPQAIDRPHAPFDHSHGPSPARAYLHHQAVARFLVTDAPPSLLAIEEVVIALVRGLLDADSRARGERSRPAIKHETEQDRRRIAEHVRELLAIDPGLPWSLDMIVEHVHTSPSHLCRIFKSQVGMSIHQYLTQLRLREAAAGVLDGESDLTHLAIRLGFSTHSHFTEAFRRTFGLPPSRLREHAEVARLALAGAA